MSSRRNALLPAVALDDGAAVRVVGSRTGTEQLRIFRDRIIPNPDQPRTVFDEASILRLAADLRERGMLQPIRVMATDGDGMHRIIMGERRWHASQMAGIDVLDCVVDYDVRSADEAFDLAIAENIQRQDLSRPELAAALGRVRGRFGLTIAQLAERYNMSEEWVSDQLAFATLEPDTQGLMGERKVATAVAHALRGLEKDEQASVLEAVVGLPNRGAQLTRIGRVKELRRSGMPLTEALSGAADLTVPEAEPVGRKPGRPPRISGESVPFVWRNVASSSGGDIAILQTRFARLQTTSRGLPLREGVVEIYLEMLDEDLRALNGACRARDDGAEIWNAVRDRLRSISELPSG